MPAVAEYEVQIVNPAGSSIMCDPIGVGDPDGGRSGWSEIKLGPRYKEAGNGSFLCRANPDLLEMVNRPEYRVVVRRRNPFGNDDVEMSGVIEIPENGYAAEQDGVDGYGRLSVQFADDIVLGADELVFPDPAHDLNSQTVVRYPVTAGNTEDRMRALFNAQLGPDAPLTERRLPGVQMGTDTGITLTCPATSFTKDVYVNDALRKLGAQEFTGGLGIGFRIVQVGARIEFQTFTPRDLTDSVIFAADMGNIVSLIDKQIAPTCTVAYVGDAERGLARIVRKRVNQPALDAGWRRRVRFVDGSSAANADELDQLGDEALKEGAPKRQLIAVVRETPQQRFRYDLGIGDLVTVMDRRNRPVSRFVIGADYTVTARGEQIQPILGEEGETLTDATTLELIKQNKRIARLEGAL